MNYLRFIRVIKIIVLIAIIFCPTISGERPQYLPNEIIVKTRKDVINLPANSIVPIDSVFFSNQGLKTFLVDRNAGNICRIFKNAPADDTLRILENNISIRVKDLSNYYRIIFKDSIDIQSIIDSLALVPDIIYVGANRILYPQTDDPNFWRQYYLWTTKVTNGWNISTGSSLQSIIAVVDGGMDYNHEDLVGRRLGGWDHGDDDSDPMDDLPSSGEDAWGDHGTAVCGVIGALVNNQKGIAGIDWSCRIIPEKYVKQDYAWYETLLDPLGMESDAADAINHAVASGAKVINISSGGYHDDWWRNIITDSPLMSACYNAFQQGVLLVGAAGNENTSEPLFPAAYPFAVAVGAVDQYEIREDYSNYGNWLDLVAPGELIYTTLRYNQYGYREKTSFSAPIVSGIAGLLKAKNPNLTNEDIQNLLQATAIDKGDPGWDQYYGYGIVNADSALKILDSHNLYHKTALGGNSELVWDSHQHIFYNNGGLSTGVYAGVKTYKVTNQIQFEREFLYTPFVWGRRRGTVGWDGAEPNNEMSYSKVGPGSVTTTGCLLETFLYYIGYKLIWPVDQWWPTTLGNSRMEYTILGIPKLLASTLSGVRSSQDVSPYIRASWTEPNINEQGYKVERKDATYNQWAEKASLDSNYTSWTDVNLMGSETYTYRVKAYNVHQNSDYSNETVVKARPNAPTNFHATKECIIWGWKGCEEYSNTVYLSWQPPGNQKLPINSYKVRIEEWYGPTHIRGPIYGLEDTLCLDPYTTYNIRVWAIDSENDDGYWAPRQVVTTGRDLCGGPEQKLVAVVPKDFFLDQNFPNPFNLQTQIRYGLPQDTHVRLIIYNILGEKVKVLVDEYQPAGERNVFWDGRNDQGETVASGIYLYRIQAASFTKTAKMSLLK
jgi:hypothetical protein